MRKEIASELLSIGAVFLRPDEPFTWASGIKSPIYCDNRLTLSAPRVREQVEAGLAALVRQYYPSCEMLMGTSTAGIAHAAIVATLLDLPMGYVRSEAKSHGRTNRIEGRMEPGSKVVVIEDLVSTGVSSLSAVAALRAAGLEVLGMVALFTYGFDLARDRFAAEGVALTTLTDYSALVAAARAAGVVRPEDEPVLLAWRTDPSRWGQEPETEER